MSQDTFPFADGEETEPHVEADAGNKKAVMVAGGVAAALVVAAGGWFLLGGNGDSTANTAFVPNHTVRPAAVAPKAVKPAKKLPAPYKAQLGRDPFKALYVVPAAAPVQAAPAASPAAVAPSSTGTTSGTGAPAGTTRYTLKLVSISKPSPETRFSTWTVAGVNKTVLPAQRFGKFGEIVVLAFGKSSTGAVDSAIIQVGDDSPIDVKIGESISIL